MMLTHRRYVMDIASLFSLVPVIRHRAVSLCCQVNLKQYAAGFVRKLLCLNTWLGQVPFLLSNSVYGAGNLLFAVLTVVFINM